MMTEQPKYSKLDRQLTLFEQLMKGEAVVKGAAADEHRVSPKTIRRDILELSRYLERVKNERNAVVFSRARKGYVLKRNGREWLLPEEVLAVAKVLLESRALVKDEMHGLLRKLTAQCVPEEQKHIEKVIANERYHYASVNGGKRLAGTIWEMTKAVREQRVMRIVYAKVVRSETVMVTRDVEPLGVMFAEYYFYLVANWHNGRQLYPAIYRLDRIESYSELVAGKIPVRFSTATAGRFEEGEFRKRVQFMKPGELLRIKFRFWGESIEAVLDRLPNARVVGRDEGGHVVEAEVFGRGVKMWLLSQAECLEVLEPAEFRGEMRRTISAMLKNYE